MESRETSREILNELQAAVAEFDPERVRQIARLALIGGVDAVDAIVNGLGAGVGRAIELYAQGDYFLLELTMCADTFYVGMDSLRPNISREVGGAPRETVVIGTVEGDRHDIGKNVVKIILEAAGFAVCDLGVDVCPQRFVQESNRVNADVVCISATLTTGLSTLPRLVDMLRVGSPRVRIIVGGGAVSEQDARQWGVDGYAADAWGMWRSLMHFVGLPAARQELAQMS